MREIKFRAWIKPLRQIKEVKFMRFTDSGVKHIRIKYKISNVFYKGEFELMAYTGLKDKNGKEIYEGDIVKGVFYRDGDKIKVNVGKVIWNYGQWNVELPIHFYEPKLSEMISGNNDCVKVIGNIYENPDLLKLKQSKV